MPEEPNAGGGFSSLPSHRTIEPDAHGQAALLLAESTLHALIEAGLLSSQQAVAAVQRACEVKQEYAAEISDSAEHMDQSLGLLAGIQLSLQSDAAP